MITPSYRFSRHVALLCLLWCSLTLVCFGQTAPSSGADGSQYGEATDAISALKTLKDKTLVIVFDVSGSMDDHGNLRRARLDTINLLREGVSPGDHVVLLTFGAGNRKVFDATVTSRADISPLVDQVPTRTEAGAGTNIREPHHQALAIVDAGLPHPGVIVLLTDSFNDEPKATDTTYPSYLKYYTPGGQLTKYPKTPENQDYERLLRKLLASGKLRQFGMGIKIAENGRPIERLPQADQPAVAPSDDTPDTTTTETPPPAPPVSPTPYIIGGVLLLALGVGVAFVLSALRPAVVRITGGGGAKDFQIGNGKNVRLGGDGAAAAFDAYPLPSAREPVALVRGSRGQLFLAPAPVKGNPDTPPRVYHNGLALEREEPLHYGDEVRISLPTGEGSSYREVRLKFEDPRKSF